MRHSHVYPSGRDSGRSAQGCCATADGNGMLLALKTHRNLNMTRFDRLACNITLKSPHQWCKALYLFGTIARRVPMLMYHLGTQHWSSSWHDKKWFTPVLQVYTDTGYTLSYTGGFALSTAQSLRLLALESKKTQSVCRVVIINSDSELTRLQKSSWHACCT